MLTIDGSDGGRNDIAISGSATVLGSIACPTMASNPSMGVTSFHGWISLLLTLNNLTLTDGYAFSGDGAGGAVEAFGDLSGDHDSFSANGAIGPGGALKLATPPRPRPSTPRSPTRPSTATTPTAL